jgi:hippurate hydrolase
MTIAELTDWTAAAEAGHAELVALRRAIHAEPELGLDCPRTTAKLKAALADLPLTIRDSEATSGFIARLDGAKPGRTVLLRGDMDALPIYEETGLDFARVHPARCMLAAMTPIRRCWPPRHGSCAGRRDDIAGTVLFMFQPGEEGMHGARYMIEEGLLDDPTPEAAFALHIFPNVPGGVIACRPGAMLASADKVGAMITGRGGHAAMPHEAIDPVPIACEAVGALQSYIARRTTFTDPAILSVTKISAGTTHNVIPDDVELLGTMRTLSDKARKAMGEAFERIITKVAEAHGATAGAWIEEGYPPTVNDPRAVALVRELAIEQFGAEAYLDMTAPTMGAEDFSYVLQKLPGAMAFLGVAPPDGEAAERAPLHNPSMMVDEAVLPRGVAMHCAFATRFLERGWE